LINAGEIIAEGSSKELKTKYLSGKIFEVECEKSVLAMDLLSKADFVNETSIFGNNIHIVVNDKFNDKNQISDYLKFNGIENIKRIDRIVPTLEDVFIHLLERENNA